MKSRSHLYTKMSKRDHIKWTEDMDNVFIDSMLDQQNKGFRVDGTFISTAYKNMLVVCAESCGLPLTKEHLKNRIKTLKVNFNQCHELFKNKSGIAWSSSSKMFEADNNVWDELIAANPSMKKWRNTPVNNYDKLVELFSKDRAIGNMAGTPRDIDMNLSTPVCEEGNDDMTFDVQRDDNIEDVASPSSIPQSQGSNTTATSSRTSKRKRKYDDSVVEVTNESIQMLMSSMEKNTNVLVNAINPAHKVEKEYTKTEIFEELNKLNLPRETLINAYILLGTNKEKTQLFFSAPDWLRGEVLSRLMN